MNKSSKTKVKIYTTGTCPFCHAAKDLLKSKKVAFEEIDVSSDDAMREKLVELTGQATVPQIFAGDESIGGYEELVRYFESGKTL